MKILYSSTYSLIAKKHINQVLYFLFLILVFITMNLASTIDTAFAARFGKGKSFGMKRNYSVPSKNRIQNNNSNKNYSSSSSNYQNYSKKQQDGQASLSNQNANVNRNQNMNQGQNNQTMPQNNNRQSSGAGSMLAAAGAGALVAGAAGYMIGKSSAENSNPQSNQDNINNESSQTGNASNVGNIDQNNNYKETINNKEIGNNIGGSGAELANNIGGVNNPNSVNNNKDVAGNISIGSNNTQLNTSKPLEQAAQGADIGNEIANNTTQHTGQKQVSQTIDNISNDLPWMLIFGLVILFVIGILLFKKKASGLLKKNEEYDIKNNTIMNDECNTNRSNASTYGNGNIENSSSGLNENKYAGFQMGKLLKDNSDETNKITNNDVMLDGIEVEYFIRQVRGVFIHIQSINNLQNINEIKQYMTLDLFNETSSSLTNNSVVPQFKDLCCNFISCQLEHDAKNNEIEQFVASVEFCGLSSEDNGLNYNKFSETWHFIKSVSTDNRWLISGIQQNDILDI